MALKAATGQALQLPNSQRIWHHSGQPRYPASADGEAKHRLPSKSAGRSRLPMPGHYPVYLTSHSPPYLHCPDKGISPSSQMSTSTLMFRCPTSFWAPPRTEHQLSPLQRMPTACLPYLFQTVLMALLQPPPLWAFSDPLTKPNVSRDLVPLNTPISEL